MAICVYAGDAADFSGNGLGILRPTKCLVRQEAAGLYEMEMVHPVTEDNRWALISQGCLIKAPTPTAETPNLEIYHEGTPEIPGSPEREIWKVRITTSQAYGYSRIYSKPDNYSRVRQKLKEGTEYEYLGRVNGSWHLAVSAEGVSGYMYTDNSVYVRTEQEIKPQAGSPGWSTVVKPRQVRQQLFRVVDTHLDTQRMELKVYARHVSYDLAKNVVTRYKADKTAPALVLQGLAGSLAADYEGAFYTDIAQPVTVDWQVKGAVAALMDPEEGLLRLAAPEGRLVRDNWDWFLLAPKAVDRGLTLRYGKNLMGVSQTLSAEDTVTRLVPHGEDKEGNLLLLPEVYVDSDSAAGYPVIMAAALEVPEAKEKEATEDEEAVTLADCYTRMRDAARKVFDQGGDGLDIGLEVDFIHLGDTAEYAAYHDLQQAYLYDTVTVEDPRVGLYIQCQVTGYTFDGILKRYESMTVGRLGQGEKAQIASWQLPAGGIAGSKLALGSLGGSRLRDLSVGNAKIANAAITYAKIAQACVEVLNAQSIQAAVARIQEVTAGSVTTNELYASIIQAVTLEVNRVTSGEITTNELYAQIVMAVAAEIGKVTAGEVETNELYAQIISAAAAELGKVTAGEVETNALYAAMVTALTADLRRVTAGEIEASELYTMLAAVSDLWAKTASIGFGQIKDLVTGDIIITEGEAGKLFIRRLAVTDMQVVSAVARELVVKGENGRYYQLTIQDDRLVPVEVEMSGDQLAEGSVSGGALVENAITTRELNAAQIFGDEATLRTLFAGMGQFGEIFAASAVMPYIQASLVESEAFQLLAGQAQGNSTKIIALESGLQARVTRVEYDKDLEEKADAARVAELETRVSQDATALEVRVSRTENGLETLETGVKVDRTGVALRQPGKNHDALLLKSNAIMLTAPGRDALIISRQRSWMPTLSVEQVIRGNLVSNVSGKGTECRIVDQWLEDAQGTSAVLGRAVLGQMKLGEGL